MNTSEAASIVYVHPLRRVDVNSRSWSLFAVAIVLVIVLSFSPLGQSAARPLPILDPATWACTSATLPLRIAALQPSGVPWVDPIAWVEQDEFAHAQTLLWLGRSGTTIYLVVLAYLASDPVAVEFLVLPFGGNEPTWSETLAPKVSSYITGDVSLFAYYLAVEIPRSEWRAAFPETGPYTIVARPASDPTGTHDHGFCSAEASSWVFAVRP